MAINTGNNEQNIIDLKDNGNGVFVEASQKIDLSKEKVEDIRENALANVTEDKVKNQIVASGKIEYLTNQISVVDTSTITKFGAEPALQLANVADDIIKQYDSTIVDNTARLVNDLCKIMKKIDIDEIKTIEQLKDERKKKSGIFAKFRETAEEKLEKLTKKYNGISKDIEDIVKQLGTYQDKIHDLNDTIGRQYEAAINQYMDLQEYIVAADQATIELQAYADDVRAKAEGDAASGVAPDDKMALTVADAAKLPTLMSTRARDLRSAAAIALQAIPTYAIQKYTNDNLSLKIDSAFINTIPAFKTAVMNLITSKQQMIMANGLAALDEVTQEFYEKSAVQVVNNLKLSQQLASGAPITAESIEKTWNVIIKGMEEYQADEKRYAQIREQEKKKIDACNEKYKAQAIKFAGQLGGSASNTLSK